MSKLNNRLVEGRLTQSANRFIYNIIKRVIKLIYNLINKVLRYVDRAISYYPLRNLVRNTSIEPNTIVFLTYQGSYTCNPRAIADEFIRQNLPYNLVWMTKGEVDDTHYPSQLKLVPRGSYEAYQAIASARVIIDNAHNLHRLGLRKKPGQLMLQTWHGSLGIKRLDGDVVMNSRWKRLAQASQEDTDYCLSNSQFETDVFHSSYWDDVPVLTYGHARNDVFFVPDSTTAPIRKKVHKKLRISQHAKICLYAPTHRDGEDEKMFNLDYEGIKQALEDKFGGEWVIALRFHARLITKSRVWAASLPDYVVDATMYPDIQDIMLATDVGLTDYSSWIFDFVLTGRPGFIIADDLHSFSQARSFYYPLESTPFPVAETNEQLVSNIADFSQEVYDEKVRDFLDRLGCIEDGQASERTVMKIHEILTEGTK